MPSGFPKTLVQRLCVICEAPFWTASGGTKCTCTTRCYNRLPSTIARKSAHAKTPEAKRKMAEHQQTPDAKARKAEREKTPERIAQVAGYHQVPANQQRKAARQRARWLREYGLTVEQFDAMLLSQDGLCGICHAPPSGERAMGVLHIDHDHVTGVVRKLLCGLCNSMLAMARDNASILRAGARYLEEFAQVSQIDLEVTNTKG